MIYRCWDVSLVTYFTLIFFGVDSSSELPPPRNLSLSWDHCSVTAQWREPANLDSECKVNYTVKIFSKTKFPPNTTIYVDNRQTTSLSCTSYISNENDICITIMTNPLMCESKSTSKPLHQCFSPPKALVKNFSCIYYSNNKMNCSWNSNISDLQLHYGVLGEGRYIPSPCTSYITSGPLKTGCHINSIKSTDIANYMCLIINSSEVQSPPNSFFIKPQVKPNPPKLTIKREGEYLHFQSSIPDFNSQCWEYKFKYRKCENEGETAVKSDSLSVPYDEACKYTVQVMTNYIDDCGSGASDWSKPEDYGEDVDANRTLKVASIFIPIAVSCCLITALVLFKRHKDIILPAIPEPSLLLKDMLNSNSDGLSKNIGVGKVYVPIREVVEKDVRLEPKWMSLFPGP
ncbi:interleukin-13 receptor subunit alpha-1-like [Brachyhypopomus gauderio]|uniref:interleukin-13 receptor subunit alpha-1-like n=1 Tax=Brachyhypopomus gauderio TaxID=698409 RepID=UPI004040FB39